MDQIGMETSLALSGPCSESLMAHRGQLFRGCRIAASQVVQDLQGMCANTAIGVARGDLSQDLRNLRMLEVLQCLQHLDPNVRSGVREHLAERIEGAGITDPAEGLDS